MVTAVGVIFQALSVLLFTYYLVADGPRLRRSICSRLNPARQAKVLQGWELAITKTGGYLYSRALLALLSAFFHWIVFQSIGTPAPIALALWVGLVSQFLPVVGTYLAGVLPVLLTLLDSPLNAAIVIGFVFMAVGLGMGVTVFMLPVGVPLGLLGLGLLGLGLARRRRML